VGEDGRYTLCCVLGNGEIGYARCAKQDRDEGWNEKCMLLKDGTYEEVIDLKRTLLIFNEIKSPLYALGEN
jgi:hypothetical protein